MDPAAVVAVERLDDVRETEAESGGRGVVLGPDDLAARNGQPGRIEEAVRQALVRRDVDGDAGRPRGHRRPDPLLVDALAELDERVAVEADVRDVAARRFVEDRLCARAECLALGEADEALELGHEVESEIRVVRGDEVVDEGDGDLAGLDPDGLLAELVDHVVVAVLAGAPGLAVADVGPGEVLELEGDVLGDVAGPRAFSQAGDEAAAPTEAAGVVLEARQEADEGVGEARDLVAWEILEDAEVDDHPDDRLAGPVVRAAEDSRFDDPEGRLRAAAVRGAVARAASLRGCDFGGGRRRVHARARARNCRLPGAWFRCRLRHEALLPRAYSFASPECTRPRSPAAPETFALLDDAVLCIKSRAGVAVPGPPGGILTHKSGILASSASRSREGSPAVRFRTQSPDSTPKQVPHDALQRIPGLRVRFPLRLED